MTIHSTALKSGIWRCEVQVGTTPLTCISGSRNKALSLTNTLKQWKETTIKTNDGKRWLRPSHYKDMVLFKAMDNIGFNHTDSMICHVTNFSNTIVPRTHREQRIAALKERQVFCKWVTYGPVGALKVLFYGHIICWLLTTTWYWNYLHVQVRKCPSLKYTQGIYILLHIFLLKFWVFEKTYWTVLLAWLQLT